MKPALTKNQPASQPVFESYWKNKDQHEQRCAAVAAYLYYLGTGLNSAIQEINAVINIAMAMMDRGYSGASAYEFCARALKATRIQSARWGSL
jgi:hypothetical protein